MTARTVKALILWAGMAVGCGAIDDPGDPGDPIWTLEGNLILADPAPDIFQLRAALVWVSELTPGQTSGAVHLAQDVPVSFLPPARFSLRLYELPPRQVLHPAGELLDELQGRDLQAAAGLLLFFDDLNHNQKLDLLPPDAEVPIDYVLGPAEIYYVYYFEGDTSGTQEIDSGLNLFRLQWPGQTLAKVPRAEEISATLLQEDQQQYLMCQIMPAIRQGEVRLQVVAPDQVPQGIQVKCSANGRSLEFSTHQVEQESGVCSERVEIEVQGTSMLGPDQEPPSSWPCIIN